MSHELSPGARDEDTPFAAPSFQAPRARALIDQERRERRNAILVYTAVAFIVGYLAGVAFGWPF